MAALNGITPLAYARLLLNSLGLGHQPVSMADQRPAELLWALSGAMWLSGHPDGDPRSCPAPLAACAQGAWLALASLVPSLDPHFEASRLLGERAAIAGLSRGGRVSAGGACRLLDTADGGLALNLAREDDIELLPAWLESEGVTVEELASVMKCYPTRYLVERARLLGLAAAPLVAPRRGRYWYRAQGFGRKAEGDRGRPLVVDLSTLWAGPLCAQLLAQCGARVIKVESIQRPDGARGGPPAFYDLMNNGKESVALDIKQADGLAHLRALLERADIVIESARPRALEQMGIYAADFVRAGTGKVWLSITGYGRRAPLREWIAYGDDAGVAAGLSWLMGGDRGDPVFGGDAIADPLTGLHGALLALAAWRNGGGQLLDVALRRVMAYCISAGPEVQRTAAYCEVAKPGARAPVLPAAELGADTVRVLGELL